MFGHERKGRRRNDEVMPYNMTPGQAFDVVDTSAEASRGFSGAGPIGWSTSTFAALDVAVSAGMAPPEKKLGATVGALAAQSTALLSWYVGGAAGAAGAAAGAVIGGMVAGPLGVEAGASAGAFIAKWGMRLGAPLLLDPIVRKISRPIDRLVGESQHRVNFGGFRDSVPAFTMRQRALREMQGSLLNATQYMGREAQLAHQ